MLEGLLGLIVLVLDVWAMLKVIKSSASAPGKLIWILVIFILPVLGLIVWFLAGPKK